MALENLLDTFEDLRSRRRLSPDSVILEIGALAAEAVALLQRETRSFEIDWQGAGEKRYKVLVPRHDRSRWSRGLNIDLFMPDYIQFGHSYQRFAQELVNRRGQLTLSDTSAADIDSVVYTAVMAFAAATDLFNPSRGLGGTFFEMIVGPTISLLSGRPETGDVRLPIPGEETYETVKVDLTFHPTSSNERSLAVPTKISTRERISQAFVHARILESAQPGRFLNILCVVNENNAFFTRGKPKSLSSLYLRDTLVPRTIALYQRYVATLDGLYYLDPPHQYMSEQHPGLPPIRPLSSLLRGDLSGRLRLNQIY